MQRILIGSPIRQDPRILREFLTALTQLETAGLTIDFAFVDDNDDPAARHILQGFRPPGRMHALAPEANRTSYQKTDHTHVWREELIWKVARYKDRIIQLARQESYDGLFLVDSDLVLHPATLLRLVASNVDIVAEVFWTRWTPEHPELPQVWLQDHYMLHRQQRSERIDAGEAKRRQQEFLVVLRRPGIYEVGGLGACTLISRRALQMGVSFREIPNVSFWGEDRHFCIRAQAIGLKLHVDTHFPALHLYRESDLSRVAEYKAATSALQAEVAALDVLKRAVEGNYTHHFETGTRADSGTEATDLLAEPFRFALAEQMRAQAAVARSGETVTRCHVLWSQVISLDPNTATGEGAVVQSGHDQGQSFRDHLDLRAGLVRSGAGAPWLVADVQFRPRSDPAPPVPFVRKTRGNRLVLSMLVRNEADRYLRQALAHAASYVDAVLILDDGSTDATADVCREILQHRPHRIVSLPASGFHREWELRRKQWELTLQMQPDWILNLDADEVFEHRAGVEMRALRDQDEVDMWSFRLYDFWDAGHYREDTYWQAHRHYRPFLVRNLPDLNTAWQETAQHCGRFPAAVMSLPAGVSRLRLKHLGWASAADRERKYQRYMQLDPDGKFGVLGQYRSILDPHPRLIEWQEEDT